MELFTILKTPVNEWGTKPTADSIADITKNLGGFITEIEAGYQGKRLFAIWINPARSEAQQLHTLGHELCHLDRQHLDRLTRDEAETEAREQADEYTRRFIKGEFDAWRVDSSRLHYQ